MTVLGTPVRLAPSSRQVSLADSAAKGFFEIDGYDADGFSTWIEPRDVKLSFDPAVLNVVAKGNGFEVNALGNEAVSAIVTATVGKLSTQLSVTAGLTQHSRGRARRRHQVGGERRTGWCCDGLAIRGRRTRRRPGDRARLLTDRQYGDASGVPGADTAADAAGPAAEARRLGVRRRQGRVVARQRVRRGRWLGADAQPCAPRSTGSAGSTSRRHPAGTDDAAAVLADLRRRDRADPPVLRPDRHRRPDRAQRAAGDDGAAGQGDRPDGGHRRNCHRADAGGSR